MATKPAKVAKRAPRAPRKKNYQMPVPIPAGEILKDVAKGQWILGTSIGVGGFGEVYSAAPYFGVNPIDYPNVIKIEPHGNGPLFVEMHFYMRNCRSDDIYIWQKENKLAALGIPKYIASGSHEYNDTKYRFLVIDRYGKDLWKIFEENKRRFPEHVVYKLALQILDILEYIHHKNYVHADVKGENLLLDLHSHDQIYLVDFGLASRSTSNTEFKADPKKAHNGTLQYTSRDAHMGVPTYRGDIEILIYNIILWLCGSLPWGQLSDPVKVQKEKEDAFEDISTFLNRCFFGCVPNVVYKFMTLLSILKFNEIPPYKKFKEILIVGIKTLGHKPDGKLRLNFITTAQLTNSKTIEQKIKKPINEIRRSPRMKDTNTPNSAKISRKSTIGVVIEKKRGNLKDIKKALSYMDSDDEYDIQILKKSKNTDLAEETKKKKSISRRKKAVVDSKTNNSKDDSKTDSDKELLPEKSNKIKQKRPTTKARKVKTLDDSDITEPEVLPKKGTRSRPDVKNKTNITNKLKSKRKTVEIESDEDICET